jgi:hypothetical protein
VHPCYKLLEDGDSSHRLQCKRQLTKPTTNGSYRLRIRIQRRRRNQVENYSFRSESKYRDDVPTLTKCVVLSTGLPTQIKRKVHLKQSMNAHMGRRVVYSTLSKIFAFFMGVGESTPRPGCFTHGKATRYPLYRMLSWPHGRSGRARKISPPPGFDHRTVQAVAIRCTD